VSRRRIYHSLVVVVIVVTMTEINLIYSTPILVVTARRYASAVLAVIVCLSVRLSVTSRSCTNTAKPRIRLTTPYDIPMPKISVKFPRHHPNGGAK